MRFLIFSLVFFTSFSIEAQHHENLIETLLRNQLGELHFLTENPEKYKIQIVYTQIDRDKDNTPRFTSHGYRLDENSYFYPASTIKLFAAGLALEKLQDIKIKGVNKRSYIEIDSNFAGQSSVKKDLSSESHYPSIEHYIKKMLVLSDNDAFNRLYEFIGYDTFNEQLQSKDFLKTNIVHRLSLPLSKEENRCTNAFHFYDTMHKNLLYYQAPECSDQHRETEKDIFLGKAHMQDDELLSEPMNFKDKNTSSISDLQEALKKIIFPEMYAPELNFNLSGDDLATIRQYLSQLPRETLYPDYKDKPDNYCKFFMFGNDQQAKIPENIRIFNKIGLAYGFALDNAYIVDFKQGIEFFLTAVIFTNENETLNDGIYEYERIAFPFLDKLGDLIYDYELKRNRAYAPDLESLKITYDK